MENRNILKIKYFPDISESTLPFYFTEFSRQGRVSSRDSVNVQFIMFFSSSQCARNIHVIRFTASAIARIGTIRAIRNITANWRD